MPAKRTLLVLLLSLFLALANLTGAAALAQIKIIITNDVHGRIMTDPAGKQIGYPLLKGYINDISASGWRVFLLDSGDALSGGASTQVDHGRSMAELMGIMGYRVLAPGNHEFDYNKVENNPLYYSQVLLKTVQKFSSGAVSTVSHNLSRNGREIPGIQRNPVIIHDETNGNPKGIRLIITGIVTPYNSWAMQSSFGGYDFGLLQNPAQTKERILKNLAASLKQYDRPNDVVIVLSHVGQDITGKRKGIYITGPDLATVVNVDFVADGHSHTAVHPLKTGTAVYGNGGRHLENFLEITIDNDGNRRMERKSYDDVSGLRPDPKIENWLSAFEGRHDLSKVLFRLPAGAIFSDRNIRTANIPLGRLICRAMMDFSGADAAFHNSGGIRAGLPAGPVTVRALYDVLPFSNNLVTFSLTGQELTEKVLERHFIRGIYGLPQFYGLTIYAWSDADNNLKIAGIRDRNGAPLMRDKKYLVAMNDFMARGLDFSAQSHGELLQGIKKELTRSSDLRLEEVIVNRSLLIFPNQEEAQKAWEAGRL